MSSGTLSEELCRQGSHYLLYNWHTPYPHSPKPSHHSALGVDQAKASKGEGGIQRFLGALLGGVHMLAAATSQESCSTVTWRSYDDNRPSHIGSVISSTVQHHKKEIFEKDHGASTVKLVAYCIDDNFGKNVVSAFGAKVHVGGTTSTWYLGFNGNLQSDDDISVYYNSSKPLTCLTVLTTHH